MKFVKKLDWNGKYQIFCLSIYRQTSKPTKLQAHRYAERERQRDKYTDRQRDRRPKYIDNNESQHLYFKHVISARHLCIFCQ